MGLRDDDERLIAEDALLHWAQQMPQDNSDPDYPRSEIDQIYHNDAVKQWAQKRPPVRRQKYHREE